MAAAATEPSATPHHLRFGFSSTGTSRSCGTGPWAAASGRDLVGDAIPHAVGRLAADERHHRRHLAVLGHLGASARVLLEVLLDLLTLVGVDGVERERTQQLVHLGRSQPPVHDGPPVPMSTSVDRIRLSPERMRLFTVPSGSLKSAATSR